MKRIRDACSDAGFDLVAAVQVGAYNDAVDDAYRLPDFGSPASLAVVVGNTSRLWAKLQEAVASDPALSAGGHPVDSYITRRIEQIVATLPVAAEVRFGHEAPPRRVAMQRLAHVAGMAHLGPAWLSVHPTHGPWISLRAAIVLDLDASGLHPEAAPDLCASCPKPCLVALERVRARASEPPTAARPLPHWEDWLAVRDACPVGRHFRYPEPQLRYHYTRDPRAFDRPG
ncbi:MAG: hypothetical protein H6744_13950 [Deltaproteobacteria bacterium]|nr:hypothetical protein [Deltaproteobacteria bacterium]MCB9787781.1 hypothetical protein [Deltaproteobacteria bacterium]